MNAKFFKFASWDNRYNFPGGIDDPEIQSQFIYWNEERKRPDMFRIRVGGEIPENPADLWGIHFRPEKHIKKLQWNPSIPTEVAVDPATHRYAVLFIQQPDERTVNVFAELVHKDADFDKVREDYIERPYTKGIRKGVIDRAGDQRHQGQKSTTLLWRKPRDAGGMGVWLGYEYLGVDDGINCLQQGLSGKYYDINIDPSCEGLLYDIQNEKLDKHGKLNAIKNHGKDDCRKALTYWLAMRKGYTTRTAIPDPRTGSSETSDAIRALMKLDGSNLGLTRKVTNEQLEEAELRGDLVGLSVFRMDDTNYGSLKSA
jgi:hypothetical protein